MSSGAAFRGFRGHRPYADVEFVLGCLSRYFLNYNISSITTLNVHGRPPGYAQSS